MCRRLRTYSVGQPDHCVPSGQPGCPTKDNLRQPGRTSGTRLPRTFPSTGTLLARAHHATLRAGLIFFQYNFPSFANVPFLPWEQTVIQHFACCRAIENCFFALDSQFDHPGNTIMALNAVNFTQTVIPDIHLLVTLSTLNALV